MTSPTCNTCNNCKHVIGNRHNTEKWREWGCGNPKNILEENINPVNGLSYRVYRVQLAWNQRIPKIDFHSGLPNTDNTCGPEGSWYEEYIPPQQEPTIAGQAATEIVFDPEVLERNREAAIKAMAEKRARALLKNIKTEEL